VVIQTQSQHINAVLYTEIKTGKSIVASQNDQSEDKKL